jgi:hypothetical protein
MKLQKLALSSTVKMTPLDDEEVIESDVLLTSDNADFYEFSISNLLEEKPKKKKKTTTKSRKSDLPDLESVN